MSLKRTLVAGAIVVGTTIAAAAADLPSPPLAAPAPPPSPPMAAPGFDWSGPYIGVSAAYYFSGFEAGILAGYSIERGRLLVGLEAEVFYFFGAVSPFSVQASGRAGFLLGDRALLYASAGIGYIVGGASPLYWEAGGGVEVGLGRSVSLYVEGNALGGFGGGGCCGYNVRAGMNWHPGN